MKTLAFHILRVGTGLTFAWIGIMIWMNPEAWGGYIQPWALNLLPVSVTQMMQSTAVLDILIGLFLILNLWTWIAALMAAAHLVMVLLVSGITEATVRDIGILAGALSLTVEKYPKIWPRKTS